MPTRPSPRSRAACLPLLVTCLFATGVVRAQQPAAAPADEDVDPSLTTLHVYTARLQSAALVLNKNGQPAEIDPHDLRMRIDDGAPFAPLAVHAAGADPLSLAVLIDLSHNQKTLDQLPIALATLRDGALTDKDHLELWAVGCSTLRADADHTTAEELAGNLMGFLADASLTDEAHKGRPCEKTARVWDSAMQALHSLSTAPGRRVLLLLSDGFDDASQAQPEIVAGGAVATATAIFAVPYTGAAGPPAYGTLPTGRRPAPLALIAANAGGILFPPPSHTLADTLTSFVALLRRRYIIDYPRPAGSHASNYHIAAEVRGTHLDVILSGTTANMVSETLRRDGSTVSVDGSAGGAVQGTAGTPVAQPHPR